MLFDRGLWWLKIYDTENNNKKIKKGSLPFFFYTLSLELERDQLVHLIIITDRRHHPW